MEEEEHDNQQLISGEKPTDQPSQHPDYHNQHRQKSIPSLSRPWLAFESQAQAHAPASTGISRGPGASIRGTSTAKNSLMHHRSSMPSAQFSDSNTAHESPHVHTMMDVDSNSVDDRARRATSVLSMDDIEAAQALEGLRSGKFLGLKPHMHIQTLLFAGRGVNY